MVFNNSSLISKFISNVEGLTYQPQAPLNHIALGFCPEAPKDGPLRNRICAPETWLWGLTYRLG